LQVSDIGEAARWCLGYAAEWSLHQQLLRVTHSPLQASPSKPEPGVGTCNLYFKAPAAPFPDNILYLDGTGKGLVNNCCFPSTVAPSYAPAGQVGVTIAQFQWVATNVSKV
jgi:hypothetical protein